MRLRGIVVFSKKWRKRRVEEILFRHIHTFFFGHSFKFHTFVSLLFLCVYTQNLPRRREENEGRKIVSW